MSTSLQHDQLACRFSLIESSYLFKAVSRQRCTAATRENKADPVVQRDDEPPGRIAPALRWYYTFRPSPRLGRAVIRRSLQRYDEGSGTRDVDLLEGVFFISLLLSVGQRRWVV